MECLKENKNYFNKFYFFGYRPFNDWYMSYHYTLHKDGTISDLQPTLENSPRRGKPINTHIYMYMLGITSFIKSY